MTRRLNPIYENIDHAMASMSVAIAHQAASQSFHNNKVRSTVYMTSKGPLYDVMFLFSHLFSMRHWSYDNAIFRNSLNLLRLEVPPA